MAALTLWKHAGLGRGDLERRISSAGGQPGYSCGEMGVYGFAGVWTPYLSTPVWKHTGVSYGI